MVSPCDDRPWRLTAPWWHWPKIDAPNRDVRAVRPPLQMYDTSDPVTLFIKDPQKALAFKPEDQVQTLTVPAPSPGTKLSRFTAATLTPSGTRKVFLPGHKRFYLVACELHCDSAGFPSVSRDKVCEAGMVVRRRSLTVGDEHAPRAVELLKTIGEISARIATIDRGVEKRVLKKRHRSFSGTTIGAVAGSALITRTRVDMALKEAAVAERARLMSELASARSQLLEWKSASGATVLKEGWIASGFENVGSWQIVDQSSSEVVETVYPLHPLVPDPRNPLHDASGKTIWFGLLPTGSREVEVGGLPRFDPDTRYEVSCFVRRHDCNCPTTGEKNDCRGELIWSVPTEAFQLAGHFDPVGTGNHPITIQMPDIPVLAATTAAGARLPVQMKFPAGSALNFKVDSEKKEAIDPTTNTIPQICFLSIPLITIVATFVLNLFLPIVVLLFQLWFMLALKFCIPPSLKVGAGAAVDLDVQGKLALDAALDASIDVAIDASAGAALANALAADLNLAITGSAQATVAGNTVTLIDGGKSPGSKMKSVFTTPFMESLNEAVVADRQDEVDAMSVIAGLEYRPRVERWEVAA